MNINTFVLNVIINIISLVNGIIILKLNYIKHVKEKQKPSSFIISHILKKN